MDFVRRVLIVGGAKMGFMRTAWVVAVMVCVSAVGVAQKTTLLLWPGGNPEPSKVVGAEADSTTVTATGKSVLHVTNVSHPSLTAYAPPAGKNTGAAALVFPGGSYLRLSFTTEGTDICEWLNSVGMTCVLVKYRVPEDGHYPANVENLEDAQQAMRITRAHAAEWEIDPHKVGVIGFSAGAHLAVALSTHPDFQGTKVAASSADARPDFQMVIYPGWLNNPAGEGSVDPALAPTLSVPPTFLVQAENDYTAHVENVLIYFEALKNAKVPAELHVYTLGGHGFGMGAKELPISGWTGLAETWLKTIHVLGPPGAVGMP
jgi:acetyl esterase/lipase